MLNPGHILTAAAALLVVGCGPATDPWHTTIAKPAAALASESNVGALVKGMTMAEVVPLIGTFVATYDDSDQVGHVCFSHAYGAGLYTHTEFLGGHLQKASDGHTAPCGAGDL